MISNYEKYKILLVDDEQDILDILSTVLKIEGFNHIYTATCGQDAIDTALLVKPDIILLDIMLPDMSGYDVFKKIHNTQQVPILFISAKTEEVDRLLGFALGADDYITKPFSPKEVAFRVKARLKPLVVLAPKNRIFKLGTVEVNESCGTILKNGEELVLPAKEFKLLMYLLNNANKIVSKESICQEVWGEDFFEFDNTISVHIRRLRTKIEVQPSSPKFITTVIGLGYKLVYKGD
ncbi:MAG: response regulator transcription factor [Turicibacter sp.]